MPSYITYICDQCGKESNETTVKGHETWINTTLDTVLETDYFSPPASELVTKLWRKSFCSIKCLQEVLKNV